MSMKALKDFVEFKVKYTDPQSVEKIDKRDGMKGI